MMVNFQLLLNNRKLGNIYMKFEKSVSRIDEIISNLENGDITLEQSLAIYQEGVKLIAECKTELNNAELLVTVTGDNGDTNG